MNTQPSRDNFELLELTAGDEGVKFKTVITMVDGQQQYKPKFNDQYPITPHKDLTDQLIKLKRPLAQCHGLIDMETIVNAPEFKATPEQQESAANHTDSQLADVIVTGVKMTGENENRGIIILGTYDGQAIKSKKVKYNGSQYGFEEMLEEIAAEILSETYQFIYEGKKGQLEAFPGTGEGDDV